MSPTEDGAWACVQSGTPYVSWLARDFLYTGVPREDLESEGRLGLLDAAIRFDASHGVQFLTYASWWARRRMQTLVIRQSRAVRRPWRKASRPWVAPDVSLDEPIGRGDERRWSDVLAVDDAERPLDAFLRGEDAMIVARATRNLPPSWREVMVRRFGLDGGPQMTLAAIGEAMGLSRERVRQIEAKAMKRVRERVLQAWGRA